MRPDMQYRDDVPVIEVRVFSGDRLVALDYCADQAQVAEVMDRWAHLAGVTFLVDDFDPASSTSAHGDGVAEDSDAPISSAVLSGSGWE